MLEKDKVALRDASPYNAAITREQFLFYEMRTTAKLVCEGLSNGEVVDRIVSENLFQYPTEKSVRKMALACLRRLEGLEDQISARRLCYIGSVKDDILDLGELTVSLLEDLSLLVPERLQERFHIQTPELRGPELLDAVCKGRGWLLKGGAYDYDRCCRIVLDEFRAGKLGRITLEAPPDAEKEKEGRPV